MKLKSCAALVGAAALALSALAPTAALAEEEQGSVQTPIIDHRDLTASAFSSEQKTGEQAGSGPAASAVDGKANTYWHSQWSEPVAAYPHWITIQPYAGEDIKSCSITGVRYAQKQGASGGGARNGIVKGYEIHVGDTAPSSADNLASDKAVAKGDFKDTNDVQIISFAHAQNARHVTLKATSPLNSEHKWAAVGEIELVGSCVTNDNLTLVRPAVPVQSEDMASVSIPEITGVVYELKGKAVTDSAALADGENTVTAKPAQGYKFPGSEQTVTYTFQYDGAPVPVTIPQTSGEFQRAAGSWTLKDTVKVVRP